VGAYGFVIETPAAACLRSDIIETTREREREREREESKICHKIEIARNRKKEKDCDRSEQAVGKDTESMQKRK
jgi:hypothetical protein